MEELGLTAPGPTHLQEAAARTTANQFQQSRLLLERDSAGEQLGRAQIFQPDPEALGNRFKESTPATRHARSSFPVGRIHQPLQDSDPHWFPERDVLALGSIIENLRHSVIAVSSFIFRIGCLSHHLP